MTYVNRMPSLPILIIFSCRQKQKTYQICLRANPGLLCVYVALTLSILVPRCIINQFTNQFTGFQHTKTFPFLY